MNRGKTTNSHTREDNAIIFIEIQSNGGTRIFGTGEITKARCLGRIYFELRQDLVPITCSNFLMLISGSRGIGTDGIHYTYKGTKIHRVSQDFLFQAGDLLNEGGNCSMSASHTGGVFQDENFLLRHTAPGVLSMANQGPNTNGSIFQVTMKESPDMDDRYVVFGYVVGEDSFRVLHEINALGSQWGQPREELIIIDCGIVFPAPVK